MANQAKSTSRTIYIDSQAGELAYQRLQAQADKLSAKIAANESKGKSFVKELAKLDQVKSKMADLEKQFSQGLGPTLVQQQNLVTELRNNLNRLGQKDPGFQAKLEEYKKANAELRTMNDRINSVTDTEPKVNGFAATFKRVFEVFSAYQIINTAASAVKDFLTGAVEESEQAEAATSRLKNILENIGRSDAFDRLAEKGSEVAKRFKYLDNDDVYQVYTKLITYGKLTENQINQLLPVIVNFAAKQRVSIDESAGIIIKALEGSAKGLKEYGINVKDGATSSERFGIIMKELGVRVEGAADAFGSTFAGKAAIAKQTLKDLQEELGNNLTPALSKFYELSNKAVVGFGLFIKTLGYAFESGSFQVGVARLRAEGVIKQIEDEDKRAVTSLLKSTQSKSIDEKKKYLGTLNEQISKYESQLANARSAGDKDFEERLTNSIRAFTKARNELSSQLSDKANKILGAGGKEVDPEAEKKAEAARKKIAEITRSLRIELAQDTLSGLDAEYVSIQEKLQKQIQEIYENRLGSSNEEIKKAINLAIKVAETEIDAAYKKLHVKIKGETVNTVNTLASTLQKMFTFQEGKKNQDVKINFVIDREAFEKSGEEILKKAPNIADKVMQIFGADKNRNQRDKKAKLDLDVLRSPAGSRERLVADKALLDEEMRLAIEASDKTEAQIALIEEQYRQKKLALETTYVVNKINTVIGYVQQLNNLFGQLDQIERNRDNASLQAEIKNNDKRRREIDRLSRSKLLTEVEARRELADLDAKDQKRRDEIAQKELERGKRNAITQALINGAMGVTSVLAAKPGVADIFSLGVFRAINIGFTLATTLAQIGVIQSQKFEDGGVFNRRAGIARGSRHSQGGIDLIDSRSKRKVGEMEDDEPYMILSRNFARNNPDFIAEALDSSLNRNGARMRPFWQARPYSSVSYSKISQGIAAGRKYESGGITAPVASGADQRGGDPVMPRLLELFEQNYQALQNVHNSLSVLNNQLANGIEANVPLKKITDAQDLQNRILSEAVGG